MISSIIDITDFEKPEIRTGTIIEALPFPEARKPAYKLTIDFGEYGIKRSSAQITKLYQPEALVGKQIVAVLNLGIRRIAGYDSECLVLGIPGDAGEVILLQPDKQVANGKRIA